MKTKYGDILTNIYITRIEHSAQKRILKKMDEVCNKFWILHNEKRFVSVTTSGANIHISKKVHAVHSRTVGKGLESCLEAHKILKI